MIHKMIGDFFNNIAAELVGSALFVVLLLLVFRRSARDYRRNRAEARDLWWLPAWNVWRFVIRNIESDSSLYDSRYRAWLRRVEPARVGSSVSTFVDSPLGSAERFVLPAGQDLPVLCFRFERRATGMVFVHADKLGVSQLEIDLGQDSAEILAEYMFRIRGPFQVPYTMTRLLTIPRFVEDSAKGRVDLFAVLLDSQAKGEHCIALPLTTDEEIGIPTPS